MIDISKMESSDLDEVVRLENECFSTPWSKESLEDAMTNNNAGYLVLRADKNVVGYVGMWYGGDEAEITNVAISSVYRKQGYAYMLMEKAKEKALSEGMTKLFLEVRMSNEPAKRLYEKCGFKSIGVRKNFYEKPVEDAIVMVYRTLEGEN